MTVGAHLFLPPDGTRNKALVGHELSHLDKNLKGVRETGADNGAGVTVTDPAQRSERTADSDGVAFAAGAGTAPSVIAQRAATVQAPQHSVGDVVTRMPAEQGGSPRPARPMARPPAGRPLHVQRAPGSSSDEFSDGGITEQDLARSSRTKFIAALYEEFKKSNQWDLSGTQGGDDFTAVKRPKKKSRPRSFADTPEVKELRRVSMIVRMYLKNNGMDPVEVQAGISGDGRLVIAANDAYSNGQLQRLFEAGNGAQILANMMEDTRRKKIPAEKRHQNEIHNTAIRQHMKVKPKADSPLNLPGIQSALSSGVTVATDGRPGLHAERRILARNGGVTPEHLGGTKRPCPSCSYALYPEGNPRIHPGVFRSDDVSNIGFPEYDHSNLGNEKARAESMFQKINKIESTYVTVTKYGVEVPEIGSESESESD